MSNVLQKPQWRSSFVGKLKTRSWFPEKLGFIRNFELPSTKCTKHYPHIICIGNTFSVICLCIGNVYTRDKRVVSVTAPAIRAIVGAVNSSVTALTNYAASVSDLGRNKISHPTILCQCPMLFSSDIDVNAAWRDWQLILFDEKVTNKVETTLLLFLWFVIFSEELGAQS